MLHSNISTTYVTYDHPSIYVTTAIFQWINFTVVCQMIDLFGIATNIINIICFLKQGLNDPVNVSLLGAKFGFVLKYFIEIFLCVELAYVLLIISLFD